MTLSSQPKGSLLCCEHTSNNILHGRRLVIDEQGWLHTGDIGQWLQSGTLQIIDRKKPIFKLSQGQYVQPDKMENIFKRSLYICQAFVHGDSLKVLYDQVYTIRIKYEVIVLD